MHLTRSHYEYAMVAEFIRDEINHMLATAPGQCKYKEKIVTMKLLVHVLSAKQRLKIPNPKRLRDWWFSLGRLDLSNGDILHFAGDYLMAQFIHSLNSGLEVDTN